MISKARLEADMIVGEAHKRAIVIEREAYQTAMEQVKANAYKAVADMQGLHPDVVAWRLSDPKLREIRSEIQ